MFIVLIVLLIAFLNYLLIVRCLDFMSVLTWSLCGIVLIAANIWDVKTGRSETARDEVKRARELIEKGQHLAAGECLDRALRYDPKSIDAILARAELYRIDRMYAEAKRELLKAFELNPSSFRVHFDLGVTYLQQKEALGAISEFKQAIRLKPDFCESYYILASAYELSGDKNSALNSYRKFMEIVDSDDTNNGKMAEYVERSRARIKALS